MARTSSLITGLNQKTRALLRDRFSVSLECELALPGSLADPRGAVEYHASYVLSLTVDDLGKLKGLDWQAVTALMEMAPAADTEAGEEFIVPAGRGHFVLCALGHAGMWDELDGRDGDLGQVAAAVLDSQTGELTERLDRLLQGGTGSQFVIVNRVEIRPELRGMALGLLGTGLVLEHFAGHAACAALFPMDTTADTATARDASHGRLAQYWSRLGFVPCEDGIYVLDLAVMTLSHAMAHLCRDRPLSVVRS